MLAKTGIISEQFRIIFLRFFFLFHATGRGKTAIINRRVALNNARPGHFRPIT